MSRTCRSHSGKHVPKPHRCLCPRRRRRGRHPCARVKCGHAQRAHLQERSWRRRAESNRRWRFCRPLPYHLATPPYARCDPGTRNGRRQRQHLCPLPLRPESLERVKGLEPSTFCMASRRSSQLSYTRSKRHYTKGQGGGAIRARRGRGPYSWAASIAWFTSASAAAFCSRGTCFTSISWNLCMR